MTTSQKDQQIYEQPWQYCQHQITCSKIRCCITVAAVTSHVDGLAVQRCGCEQLQKQGMTRAGT